MCVTGDHMDQTGAKQMEAGAECPFTKTAEDTALVDLNDVTFSEPEGNQRRIALYGGIAFRMGNHRNQRASGDQLQGICYLFAGNGKVEFNQQITRCSSKS